MAICLNCGSGALRPEELAGVSICRCASCGTKFNLELQTEDGVMPRVECGHCGSPHLKETKVDGDVDLCKCVACGTYADPAKNFKKITFYKDSKGHGICNCPNCGFPKVRLSKADENGLLQDVACGAVLDVSGDKAVLATPEQVRKFREKYKFQGM